MKISDIARRVARQRARRSRVGAALDDMLQPAAQTAQAPPGRLYPGPAPVIDLAEVRARRVRRPRRHPVAPTSRSAVLAALAGAAALGALLTGLFVRGGLIRYEDGRLVARHELNSALSAQLTGQAPAGAHILLTASWRMKNGDICRNFSIAGGQMLSGTACRVHRQWQIQSVNSSGNPPIASVAGHTVALTPLSNAAETQLRANDWQTP